MGRKAEPEETGRLPKDIAVDLLNHGQAIKEKWSTNVDNPQAREDLALAGLLLEAATALAGRTDKEG